MNSATIRDLKLKPSRQLSIKKIYSRIRALFFNRKSRPEMDKNSKGEVGEDFVNQIAYKSFLHYWCFPNPKDEMGDHKEVCDLLILFKDVCIIISVKNYEFDGNYDKYNRKTIDKAINQISGAERKLFNLPRKVFIKHPNRAIESFNKDKYKSVFRIIVNLGEGVETYSPARTTREGKFVTIFNKDTFETILSELDTISDFTKYLIKRESLLNSQNVMQWFGVEKDLFALYIKRDKEFPPEYFQTGYGLMIIDFEGEWDKFIKQDSEQRKIKRQADKNSYFLDELVERELVNLENGELIAEEFLSLNRFERRLFSDLFLEFIKTHSSKKMNYTAHRYIEIGEYGVVFCYYSPEIAQSNKTINLLQTAIIGYTIHTNYRMKKMLGLGGSFRMEDFTFQYLPTDELISPTVIHQTKNAIRQLGWFKNLKMSHYSDKEYPEQKREN